MTLEYVKTSRLKKWNKRYKEVIKERKKWSFTDDVFIYQENLEKPTELF